MDSNSPSIFERNPRRTIAAALLVMMLVFLAAVEIMLRSTSGLGSPPLYMRHPGPTDSGCNPTSRWSGSMAPVFGSTTLACGRSATGMPRQRGRWCSSATRSPSVAITSPTRICSPLLQAGIFPATRWATRESCPGAVENVHGLVVGTGFLPAELYVTTLIEADFFRGFSSGLNRPHIWYTSTTVCSRRVVSFCLEHCIGQTEANETAVPRCRSGRLRPIPGPS